MKTYQLVSRIICDEIFEIEAENENLATKRWVDGEGRYCYSILESSAIQNNRHSLCVLSIQEKPNRNE